MYITYDEYAAIYAPTDHFTRLCFEACHYIDRLTTGIDGIKKLKVAFPVDEDDAQAVKYCAAKVINLLQQIQEAECAINQGRGYTATANGLQGKVVSAVSSGNEAISYSSGSSAKSVIDNAVLDNTAKEKLLQDTIREYLAGVQDANGVNLLYMGGYPCVS